jgi:bifunctional polynucleotide phosphatase/kinase
MHTRPSLQRIAAFDFDGCLARTSVGGFDPNAWSLMFPGIPAKLQEYHRHNYKIVIFTNEVLDARTHTHTHTQTHAHKRTHNHIHTHTHTHTRTQSTDKFKNPDVVDKAIRKKVGRLEGFVSAAGVPVLVLCMLRKDQYRKPHTRAWDLLASHFNGGL